VTDNGGQATGDSGSAERPRGGTMDEVIGDALALATGHSFLRGLVLRSCNDEGTHFRSPQLTTMMREGA
jgi:hypothetical protein